MIDILHGKRDYDDKKPRTYREKARRDYLQLVKQKKPNAKAIRKATGKQLKYVARELKHIEVLLQEVRIKELSTYQQKWLETIKVLYGQQFKMYKERTHSVINRIVSISQPHVRPIVRGKATAKTEFGAKMSISLVNGYEFIDKLAWYAYNEESLLIPAIEAYKQHNGCYPEAVLVDKLYRNRTNRAYCKERGIQISGPRLDRLPKETNNDVLKQEREDISGKNTVEGKFGEGKNKYGLDRIIAWLQDSSETVIAMSFFCMNLWKRLRVLLRYLRFCTNARSFCVWNKKIGFLSMPYL
jgi:hypothetical protein